ncbi:MAG: helix-turn-helix domain-containing protein [Kiritimatiellae bacterium]|nr:helix-turn-helix domain-containing protein [Kiritimatiellia bacterium]
MTLTEEIMQAALGAPDERKADALRVLRGEMPAAGAGGYGVSRGPLLLGMGAGAKLLGVSRGTLWRAMRAGRIQKVELFPGSYRVRREELEAVAAGKLGLSGYKSKRGRPKKVGKAEG